MEKILKTKSIQTRICGVIFAAIFLVTCALGFFSFYFSKNRLIHMLGDVNRSIAATAGSFISGPDILLIRDNMSAIIELRNRAIANYSPVSQKDEGSGIRQPAANEKLKPVLRKYILYTRLLSNVKKSNGLGCAINVYAQGDNRLIHILSSDPEMLTGSKYEIMPTAGMALESGSAQTSGIYKDKDGMWISAYAPIATPEGSAKVLIEVSNNIDLYLVKLRKELWAIFVVCLVILLAMSALSYKVVDNLISNLKKLNNIALYLDNENYNLPVDIKSDDEIGHLAGTFEKLRVSIKKKMNALKSSLLSEKKAHLESIITLTNAIDMRDPYTRKHLYRVDKYAMLIAKNMRLPYKEIERLRYGCYLHDIGKIFLNDSDFNKADLSPEELDRIRAHAVNGAKLISGIPFFENVKDIVMHHQESYDGRGYPDGLKGAEIPFLARIVAVADAFDAMTTDRPYKAKIGFAAAMDELERNAGIQFDPDVVRSFLKYRNTIEKIVRKHF